jgi:WD40 repeat protein
MYYIKLQSITYLLIIVLLFDCLAMEQGSLKDIVAKSIAERLIVSDVAQTKRLVDKINSSFLNKDAKEAIAHYLAKKCSSLILDISKPKYVLSLGEHSTRVTAVALGSTPTLALTSSLNEVRLWDLSANTPTYKILEHQSNVTCLALSPGDNYALIGLSNGTVCLWDITRCQRLSELKSYTTDDAIISLEWGLDSNTALTGSADGKTFLWDLSNKKNVIGKQLINTYGNACEVYFVTFLGKDKALTLTPTDDGGDIWDLTSSTCIRHIPHSSSCFRPLLNSAADYKRKIRWNACMRDVYAKYCIFPDIKEIDEKVIDIAFTPDNSFALLALDERKNAILVDLRQHLTLKKLVFLARLADFSYNK